MLIAQQQQWREQDTSLFSVIPLQETVLLAVLILVLGIVLSIIFKVSFIPIIITLMVVFSIVAMYKKIKKEHGKS